MHKILTDNGMAVADVPKNRKELTRRFLGGPVALPTLTRGRSGAHEALADPDAKGWAGNCAAAANSG